MINESVCWYSSLSKDKLVDWEFLVSDNESTSSNCIKNVGSYSSCPQFSSPTTPPVTIDGAQDPDLNHGIGASHSFADDDNLPTPKHLCKQNVSMTPPYPLCTLLVFGSRQHALPVAWVMTQSVAKCDISKWMRALLDRVHSVDPTWKVIGFLIDDAVVETDAIRHVFHLLD
nr:zinc finger, SWIM-type [Tanacetum cinerariifolium]